MLAINPRVDSKELEGVIVALETFSVRKLPNTSRAVQQSTLMIQTRWIQNAKNAFKRPTGNYLLGIQEGLYYPYQNDEYRGAVINTVPYAHTIENGSSRHDLKKALWTSAKVRISQKGKRYMIIPFRHGTPKKDGGERATIQTMPENIYAIAKTLHPSIRTESGGWGQHSYRWGGRLTQRRLDSEGLGEINKRPHWKNSPYAGMVRFPRDNSTNQTTYMTFRVMHEDSNGWIHPGTPPMKLAEKTWREMTPVVVRHIEGAFVADLRILGAG